MKTAEDEAWKSLPRWLKAYGRKNFVLKYNHNHDPKNGRFISADGSSRSKDPVFQKKQKFVNKYLSSTEKVAHNLNVPTENLLGLAALESGWGADSRFAVQGNSFFSMHYPAPHATGYISAGSGGAKVATFASYDDSLNSFANRYGSLISGVTDPKQFATTLQQQGKFGIQNGGYDPTYVPKLVKTINGLSSFVRRAKSQ